jgi:hypothetical protein
MDRIAWHEHPVGDSDFFIRVDLSEHGMSGRYEQLWVKRRGETTFEVRCVPFFAHGVALGDTAETDAEFTLRRVVLRGGHATLRVAVADREQRTRLRAILQEWIAETELLHEWFADGYVAIDLPPNAEERINKSLLRELAELGAIEWEIDR